MNESLSLSDAAQLVSGLRKHVEDAVFGQEDLIVETICCLLSNGHILMTGAPGLAKTTLVRVFAHNLGLQFGRVQFTPDLLPSDIIGSEVLSIDVEAQKRTFEFSAGPIFTNMLLADEINRASPRTQSALLEAMQERTCTVGGKVHKLPPPFMVFATQNPFESEGTFPLPEAQLDRFLVHSLVGYPDEASESKILMAHSKSNLVGENLDGSKPSNAIERNVVEALIKKSQTIGIDENLVKCINFFVRSTRPTDSTCPSELKPAIWYGAGPRAGLSLISLCKSLALLNGEESVRWAHLKRMAKPALRHRIKLSSQAGRDRITEDELIEDLLSRIEDKYAQNSRGLA